jgi:acyl dehydratase
VVTSWSNSIYRAVAVDGGDAAVDEPPTAPPGADTPLDGNATTREVAIAREAPHVYTECAAIWNPIHTERAVAIAAGLPDIILHGTATWALAGIEILRVYAACDVSRLKRFSGRFVGMVIPGETISIRHARVNESVVRFEVLTQNGAAAIDQGFAVLR